MTKFKVKLADNFSSAKCNGDFESTNIRTGALNKLGVITTSYESALEFRKYGREAVFKGLENIMFYNPLLSKGHNEN